MKMKMRKPTTTTQIKHIFFDEHIFFY